VSSNYIENVCTAYNMLYLSLILISVITENPSDVESYTILAIKTIEAYKMGGLLTNWLLFYD